MQCKEELTSLQYILNILGDWVLLLPWNYSNTFGNRYLAGNPKPIVSAYNILLPFDLHAKEMER